MRVANVQALGRSVIAAAAGLALLVGAMGAPASADQGFRQWVASFRSVAAKSGISGSTYDRAFRGVTEPDPEVIEKARFQPEFTAPVWDYFDNRVHENSVAVGRQMARKYKPWLDRIESRYGVDRYVLLAIWSMESNYGEILSDKKVMRNVVRSLSTLAYADKKRAKFARTQLIAALKILQSGDIDESHLTGSWAGAMGHTQWMPEVWLNIGADYDGDGRANPFGKPDDALAGTCRYLIQRGGYRPGEPWGCEVRGKPSGKSRSYAEWQQAGIVWADGKPYSQPNAKAKGWVPVPGGPSFLIGANFDAVKSYNPSMNYALAICHLGDRVMGGEPFVQSFPDSERAPTLAEIQEIQTRLTKLGFNTAGTDGRVGLETMRAARDFQRKIQIEPADGYAGVKLLARLRAVSS